MKYRFLEEHQSVRKAFLDKFVLSYTNFLASHREWISRMGGRFDEDYFERMLLWEKLSVEARVVPLREALAYLKSRQGNVFFLTEPPKSYIRQFCLLNNQREYVAEVSASALAECVAYEWFTDYELAEKGCYLADALLPAELYIFDTSLSWCVIFTHETDETESADSRVCFLLEKDKNICE